MTITRPGFKHSTNSDKGNVSVTDQTDEQQYIAYRDNLAHAMTTMLSAHHQGAVLEVAVNMVLDAAAYHLANGDSTVIDAIERHCAEIRAGNAEAAE